MARKPSDEPPRYPVSPIETGALLAAMRKMRPSVKITAEVESTAIPTLPNTLKDIGGGRNPSVLAVPEGDNLRIVNPASTQHPSAIYRLPARSRVSAWGRTSLSSSLVTPPAGEI